MKQLIGLTGAILWLLASTAGSATKKTIRIGFFEAGDYYTNTLVRNEFRDALEHLIPPSVKVIYVPNGFKTAEWKRDQCKAQAADFVRDTSIDIVVAIGPWVIKELLNAGFTRPIIGIWQQNPESEGLLDAARHPIADNLTVHTRPDQIKQDMTDIVALYHPKVVGVLAFNDDPNDTAYFQKCWQIGKSLGIKVVWAQGYNSGGVYAYFKGYSSLPKPIDALYVGPLWGMTLPAIGQFAANAFNDGVPVFTSEGRYMVEKGLSSSGTVRGEQSAAVFAAWKTARIIGGTIPADLPLEYPAQRGFVLNKSILEMSGERVSPEIWSQATIVDEFAVSNTTAIMTLSEVLSNAQTQNPGLQATASKIDAAAQRLEEMKKGYWPTISLDASATTAADGATSNTGDIVSQQRYRAGVLIDQPLYAPQVLKSIQLARKEQNAAEATSEQASIDLQRAVRATYRDCLTAQQRVMELTRLRDRTEEFKEIARLRAFIDPDSPDDSPRWYIQRLQVVRDLITARQNLQGCFSALHALMGRPVLDSVMLLDSSGWTAGDFLDQFVPLRMVMTSERFGEAAVKFLESEATKHNPSMRQKSAEVGLEESRIALDRANRAPRLGVHGWFGYVDSLNNGPDLSEKHNLWSLSAQMSWPLFSHGKRSAQIGDRERALGEKDSIRLEVARSIRSEWRNLWSQGVQLPLAAQASDQAKEYSDSVKFDYMRGKRAVVDALDALETDHRLRLAQLDIRQAYFQSAEALAGEIGWLTFDQSEPGGRILITRLQEYLRGIAASGAKP